MGSQWSYSGVAVDSTTQAVIDTDQLNSILSNVIPFALLANPTKAAKYVHVEAGIKLWDLNCRITVAGRGEPAVTVTSTGRPKTILTPGASSETGDGDIAWPTPWQGPHVEPPIWAATRSPVRLLAPCPNDRYGPVVNAG